MSFDRFVQYRMNRESIEKAWVAKMKSLMTRIAILVGCLALCACSSDPERGGVSEGCIPLCTAGLQKVAECTPDDADCHEEFKCGITILCVEEHECSSIAEPAPGPPCEDGYELVDECDNGSCRIIGGYCGVPEMFCQLACEPIGGCPPDTHEVPECLDGGAGCFEEPICDFVIYCAPDVVNCDVPPVCPADYYLVQSCPTDTNCFEDVVCEIPISCMEGSIDCLTPPECPVGTTEVEVCVADKPCNELIECGIRLYCEDNVI